MLVTWAGWRSMQARQMGALIETVWTGEKSLIETLGRNRAC